MITQRQIEIAAYNCFARPESYCVSMAIDDFLTHDKLEHNAENWNRYYDLYAKQVSDKETEYIKLQNEVEQEWRDQVKKRNKPIRIKNIPDMEELHMTRLRQDQMQAINFSYY